MPDFPSIWAERLAPYVWTRQTIGESKAAVFRLDAENHPSLFVKCEKITPFSELSQEAECLAWLARIGQPAPRPVDFTVYEEHRWLLMTALPGHDLASSDELSPERRVELFADALKTLHAVPIATCPFDRRLAVTLDIARVHMEAGIVDETDFDDERSGRSAHSVFVELMESLPAAEDLVVTHGDACLPNFMADTAGFTGFLDCSRLGVSCRYRDLAIACNTIVRNLDETFIPVFFARYGIAAPDDTRISFYRQLDEFF
jgi:aminoglycoside 3'-phosphotransferase-2